MKHNASVNRTAPIFGVDISEMNNAVDFSALQKAGVRFVLIRCGYGSDDGDQDDVRFLENVRKADAAGMPWGAYLYSYALNVDMAQSEARHMLRLLNGRKPAYGVWYDVEDGQQAGADLVKLCEVFCGAMEAAGLYAGIYSMLAWMETKLDKLAKTAAYFEEYRQAMGVPLEYADLNQSGVRPTMSASVKSMKEAAKAYLDRVAEDLRLIDSQEGREEMLLEYRRCGSAAQAITTVKSRWEAVEAEKRRQEERAGEEARARELAEQAAQAAQAWAPPQALPPQPESQPEPRFTVGFTVKNVTKAQAKALRDFLQQGGYDYE